MLCIVQCRMSSQRLPGKMMLEMAGRILLSRVLDRLVQAKKITKIIVATSDEKTDQPIVDFCIREHVPYICGSLNNVALRFRQAIEQEHADAFIRISGDSPLIDPKLVDLAVSYFELNVCDLVTNVLIRTFPKGQSVEVVFSKTFLSLCDHLKDAEGREHVTKIFYDDPKTFRIVSFTSGVNFGRINLSVDNYDDFIKIETILKRTENKPGNWRELALMYETL